MYNILLVGAGQLGSRYLQGIAQSKSEIALTVVDKSQSSLSLSKHRWIEQLPSIHVNWCSDVPIDLKQVELALVLTSSFGRASLIEKISDLIDVRHWVLEKVLAQSSREVESIQVSTTTADGCWVNTPRRLMSWYKRLKDIFSRYGIRKMSYIGSNWGLACNSIHYIDLLSWWSGEVIQSISTDKLKNEWFESKRRGYYEVMGELTAKFSGGLTLTLRCLHQQDTPSLLLIELINGDVWSIDEKAGIAVGPDSQLIKGELELQSSITSEMVDKILQYGQCDLPCLGDSATMHSTFLDAMLLHWNRSQNKNDKFISIT